MVREVWEELGIHVTDPQLFWSFEGYSEFLAGMKRYWIFEADVTELWPGHVLMEGQRSGVFSFSEIAGLLITPLALEVIQRHQPMRDSTENRMTNPPQQSVFRDFGGDIGSG